MKQITSPSLGFLDLRFVNVTGDTMTGDLLFTDNTLDIGASGATRPRTGYFGTSVVTPLIIGTNIKPSANSTTAIQLQNAAGTSILNVDTTNGRVGIGTTAPTSPLHITRTATNYSGPAIAIKGMSIAGTGDDANGFGLYLSYNLSGNRQFVFADTATGNGVRFINSAIDGFNVGTQARADLQFGTETNGAHVAVAVGSSQFSVNNVGGTASKVVTELKGAASQSGNYLNISSSGGTGDIVTVQSSGNVGIGTTTPTNLLSLGGNSARIFWLERGTVAATQGFGLTVEAGGATVASTDKTGGNLTLKSGVATGTGTSDIILQSHPAGSTGTADTTATEVFRVKGSGSIVVPVTITAVGTTGNQTINKAAGRVNIAAEGTTVTVTNSLVSANSIVLAVAATADATARVTNVVPAAGSFVINTVAVTAETAFNFLVIS